MQTMDVKGAQLSLQQERLWKLQQEKKIYHVQCAVWVDGSLAVATLQTALHQIINEHEILHTRFALLPGMEVPVQAIDPEMQISCPYIDIETLYPSLQEIMITELEVQMHHEPFDLFAGPLMRVICIRLHDERHLLLLSASRLCVDSATLFLLLDLLKNRYIACLKGEVQSQEPLQYVDVTAWQEDLLNSEDATIPTEFWQTIDWSLLEQTVLPFAHIEAQTELEEVHNKSDLLALSSINEDILSYPVVLEEELQSQLTNLLREEALQNQDESVSQIEMLLLTTWAIVLWRLTDQPDLLLGLGCDGRGFEELNEALGPYARMLPLSLSLDPFASFHDTLLSLRSRISSARAWQAYFSWPDLPSFHNHAAPFFPLAFSYQAWPDLLPSPFPLRLFHHSTLCEPSCLLLSAVLHHGLLHLHLHADAALFSSQTLARLSRFFHTCLSHALLHPHTPLALLPLLPLTPPAPVAPLLETPPPTSLSHLFLAHVEQTPDAIALLTPHTHLSFLALQQRVAQLAHLLRQHDIGPHCLVALWMERSPEQIIALLAILETGAAYLPLDPHAPLPRLLYQIRHSAAHLLLAHTHLLPRHDPAWSESPCPLLTWEQCVPRLSTLPTHALSLPPDEQALAYLIYTSGSTGQPKGVLVEQRSLLHYLHAIAERLHPQPCWRYGNVSTLAADLGHTVLFLPLLLGGCLLLPDYETFTVGQRWQRWSREQGIDVLKLVPSHLAALLNPDDEQAADSLPTQLLLLGGEPLPTSLVERVRRTGATCRIYNHYGPTETTVGVLLHALEDPLPAGPVALGSPLGQTRLFVVDHWGQQVPQGVIGELCIGGPAVARGYHGESALTAQAFVPDGWSQQRGARLYRTGDRVYERADGRLVFVGRADRQVKLRGYRIELSEIETTLRLHPQVWDAVVVLRDDLPGNARLVSYMVPKQQAPQNNKDLRDFLATQLPDYMVPATFVWLKSLPLNANGKLDRRQLPVPEPEQETTEYYMHPPRNPIEEILQDIWQNILGTTKIGIHDNFFQIGGHSLLATQVIARVRSLLKVDLSIASLFELPTIAQLAQKIEHELRGQHESELPALRPQVRPTDLPLSFAQQRLWFLDQLEPNSTAYLVRSARILQGALNTRALERSLATMVQRHESLRTTFQLQARRPIQIIHHNQVFHLPFIDLSKLAPEIRSRVARHLAEQEAGQPCSLEHGPLLRTWLLHLQAQEHALLVTMHHIISDGWSHGVFEHELATLYKAFAAGQPSPLKALPIQYADYALWQRQWLQGAVLQAELAYWQQRLTGALPLELPTDHPRPAIKSYEGAFQAVALPPALQKELIALSQQEGVTLFMLLLAAFQVLLARYSGQNDISVGSPIANRTHAELDQLIGFFVNTLVLRSDLSDNPPFVTHLKQVREMALEAYNHQDVPFEHLVDVLHPERDLSRSPLFQVMFVMQQTPGTEALAESEQTETLSLHELTTEHRTTKFDLTLFVTSTEHGMFCGVEYSTDLFEASTIQRLLEHWQILLQGIVAHPQQKLAYIPLLTVEEQDRLLLQRNQTGRNYPLEQSFIQLFNIQAATTPSRIALTYDGTHMTYAELDRRANQLAHCLQTSGIGPEVLVGLYMERSLEMVVAILGIFKAGGAYVPLDAALPTDRLRTMVEDADLHTVITQPSLQADLAPFTVTIITLEASWKTIASYSEDEPLDSSVPTQLAYVIYTSGSTGQPKGAMVHQRGMLNHLYAKIEALQLGNEDIVAQTASHCFDISVWQFLAALLVGGQVHIFPDQITHDPIQLFEKATTAGISIHEVVPSLLHAFLIYLKTSNDTAMRLPQETYTRWLLATGEMLPVDVALLWMHFYPDVLFLNAYGPTECSDDVTHALLTRSDLEQHTTVPVGRPIANTRIYLLNEALALVPDGIPAQIYVGGTGVGRGYLGDPARTASVFLPDPFSADPGARLYKTGDMGRYRQDGSIEFLHRIDQQVKIRGFRIELGEITTMLKQHPVLQDCVVMLREDQPGDTRLVAYILTKHDPAPTITELHRFLQKKLPEYMIPTTFVTLPALPLTANGKVDLRALPIPGHERPDLDETFVAPRTTTEEVLTNIWATVLGIEQVGIRDNFFALGGDSIRSIQVLAQARERGINFSLQQLFKHQTIEELLQALETDHPLLRHPQQVQPFSLITAQDSTRPPDTIEDAYPLAMLQAGMLFHSIYYPDSAIYHDIISYHLRAPLHLDLLTIALQTLITRHSILRTSFDMSSYSEPLQLVHRTIDVPLTVADLRNLAMDSQEKELASWIALEQNHLFDLSQAPLLRFQVHQRAEAAFQFTLSLHHAILDGWSIAILFTELFKLYLSLVNGKEFVQEPPPAVQYRDFVALEREQIAPQEAQDYWTHRLSGSTHALLPRWTTREQRSSDTAVHMLRIPFSKEITMRLKQLARENAVPLKSVLLAAHLRVLSVLHGQADVVTGLVTHGRPETADGERALGLFLNTLPLRLQLTGGTWSQLIQATFAAECELLPYRRYPLIEIQKLQGGHSLFETMFNFAHFHVYQDALNQDTSHELQVVGSKGFEQSNFSLAANFSLDMAAMQVHLSLRCNAEELAIEQVRAIATYYTETLATMSQMLPEPYEYQSILPTAEYQQVVLDWNKTRTEYPSETRIHEVIEQQVQKSADAIAITYDDQHLSYTALNQGANHLAYQLRAIGTQPGMLVGLYMDRCLELPIALLGILKAGGAYVPLDPTYPAERVAFMVEDSQIPLLVTQSRLATDFPGPRMVCLPDNEQELEHFVAFTQSNLMTPVIPWQTAYAIYTSGSTGRPKGTLLPHHAVINFFQSMCSQPGMQTSDHVLASTSLSFDIAVLELLLPLTVGARVQLISRETAANPLDLAEQVKEGAITLMQATPTTWRMLLNSGWENDHPLKILCGGEVLPLELARQLRSQGTSLWNMYGPTETTIWSAVSEIKEPVDQVTIGHAIDNTQIYLLDKFLLPVPIGVTAELYIGGDALAPGYWHRPDLSAERFLPDPFSSTPGTRMYRTGDLARWHADGNIECLGRVDRQAKVRGYRIELDEIEEVLFSHPQVKGCVVVIHEITVDNKQLIAYIAVGDGPAPATRELRSYLQSKLPEYMLPAQIIPLVALPLSPNGKVNRNALPAPEDLTLRQEEPLVAPRTPIEEMLVEIWTAVLHRTPISIHDNFFELGGHSLLATQTIARLRTTLQIELPLRSLFEAPTIATLAPKVEQVLSSNRHTALPPILVTPHTRQAPLSFAQQRLWFLDQLEPGSTAYLIINARLLHGELNNRALEQSLAELIQRHEILRTTFAEQGGQLLQVIHPASVFHLPLIDLQALSEPDHKREALHLGSIESQHPCNLAQGPLLRTFLIRLDNLEHVLLISMHHSITDAWSNQLFYQELITLYRAFAAGHHSPLTALTLQYADYARWQRQWLQGAVLESQLAYWQHQLAGVAQLEFPTDHPRPPIQKTQGSSLFYALPDTLGHALNMLSQREGVTLFMLLLASFQVLLARYSGQTDICIGTPIANRTVKDLEQLIGFFVNTLVLRCNLADNPPFVELLKQVREVTLEAYAHQDIPFEHLVEALQPERDLSRSPLFQVMFVMQHTASPAQVVQDSTQTSLLSLDDISIQHTTSRFDLTLTVTNSGGKLYSGIEYNSDLFEQATVRRLLERWQILLEGIVNDPTLCIAELPLLSVAEKHSLLVEKNETFTPPSIPFFISQQLDKQMQLTPDAIALIYKDQQLSYTALQSHVNQLAHLLQVQGVAPDVLVGICLPRSVELVISLLATLKAGGAYLPLDPTVPRNRLQFMVNDAQAFIVITTEDLAQNTFSTPQVLCLEHIWSDIIHQCEDPLPCNLQALHLAYLIYTSGSTGSPKGVMVTQQGLANYLTWCSQRYQVDRGHGSAVHSSIGFDLTVTSLFAPLLAGQTVTLIPEEQSIDGLINLLQQHQHLSLLKITPAHLDILAHTIAPDQLANVTQSMIIGGEALSAESLLPWRTYAPDTHLINEYGPTETVVGCCIHEVTEDDPETGTVAIGRPIANTQLYILDQYMQPLPEGLAGELYIGGDGLTRGYMHSPALTAERFLPHPFSQEVGARLYKSGDIARYRATGVIEYLGRMDQQIKIRGYRIEPGEIESVVLDHPQVRDCIVLANEHASDDRYLVAYIVPVDPEQNIDDDSVYQHLHKNLPDYMVPQFIIHLAELPLTANGKVDRRLLPSPERQQDIIEENQRALPTQMESLLIDIWKEVLHLPHINMHANFFALGGHSLLAVQVIARLRSLLSLDLPLRSLFEAPTISSLAQHLQQIRLSHTGSSLPPLLPQPHPPYLPLSFAQQRLWFIDQLEPISSAYLIPRAHLLTGPLHLPALDRSLDLLIARHASLRTTFPAHQGLPYQMIAPRQTGTLPIIDLSGLPPQSHIPQARRLTQQEAQQPCDLLQGPLLRTCVLRLTPQRALLLVTLHHIIADGWSLTLFFQEWLHLYQALLTGTPPSLPPLPIQYADYALWQRAWLQGPALETRLDYWTSQLGGAIPLEAPLDRPRPARLGQQGGMQRFLLSPELSQDILHRCQHEGVTIFMLLLASWYALLTRWSGQADLVVGTDSANRDALETEAIIGFFINLLPLRLQIQPSWTFSQLLKRVREVVLEATEREIPFEMLVEHLGLSRGLERMPLIQSLLVWQELPSSPQATTPQPTRQDPLSAQEEEQRAAKFELALFAWKHEQGITGTLIYKQELFAKETMTLLLARWQHILQQCVHSPEQPLKQMDYYSEAEQQQFQQREQILHEALSTQEVSWLDLSDIDLDQDTFQK